MNEIDFSAVRNLYLCFYIMALKSKGYDEITILKILYWESKTRPDIISIITGEKIVIVEHLQETCFNQANDLYREFNSTELKKCYTLSDKRIDNEMKSDQTRPEERNAMLRFLNLDKIADFMLETGTNSFGFVDLAERASYSAFLTKTDDGIQKITVEKKRKTE